jgi:uncharacterized protein YlxW (UPF0749 family)
MKVFVKTVLFSGLGLSCLALGSGAQTPPPAPPKVPSVVVGGQLPPPVPAPPGVYSGTTFMRSGDRVWAYSVTAEDGKAVELARKMAAARGEEKEKLEKQLTEVLNKSFDDRQKRHEKEIEALEAQVKKLKEMVSKRKVNRDEIIAERMKQLERDASGLGW